MIGSLKKRRKQSKISLHCFKRFSAKYPQRNLQQTVGAKLKVQRPKAPSETRELCSCNWATQRKGSFAPWELSSGFGSKSRWEGQIQNSSTVLYSTTKKTIANWFFKGLRCKPPALIESLEWLRWRLIERVDYYFFFHKRFFFFFVRL